MPDVISDTSPVQYLYQAGVLHLLPALFGRVHVPDSVLVELEEGRWLGVSLPRLKELPWLTGGVWA